MTRLALLIPPLLLLGMLGAPFAAAQSPASLDGTSPGPLGGAPLSALPHHPSLAATRHEQPRESQVSRRERQAFGPGEAQRQRRRLDEVDRLYGEILRQSESSGERR